MIPWSPAPSSVPPPFVSTPLCILRHLQWLRLCSAAKKLTKKLLIRSNLLKALIQDESEAQASSLINSSKYRWTDMCVYIYTHTYIYITNYSSGVCDIAKLLQSLFQRRSSFRSHASSASYHFCVVDFLILILLLLFSPFVFSALPFPSVYLDRFSFFIELAELLKNMCNMSFVCMTST